MSAIISILMKETMLMSWKIWAGLYRVKLKCLIEGFITDTKRPVNIWNMEVSGNTEWASRNAP